MNALDKEIEKVGNFSGAAGRVGDILTRPIDYANNELDKYFLKDDIKHFARRLEDYDKIYNPIQKSLTPTGHDPYAQNKPTTDELNAAMLSGSDGTQGIDADTKSKLDEMLLDENHSHYNPPYKAASLGEAIGGAGVAGGLALLGSTAYLASRNKERAAREKEQNEAIYAMHNRKLDREFDKTLNHMEYGTYKRNPKKDTGKKTAGLETPALNVRDYATGAIPGALLGGTLGGPVGALAGGGAGTLLISALRDPVAREEDVNAVMRDQVDKMKMKAREAKAKNMLIQQLAASGQINQENLPRVLGTLKP